MRYKMLKKVAISGGGGRPTRIASWWTRLIVPLLATPMIPAVDLDRVGGETYPRRTSWCVTSVQ